MACEWRPGRPGDCVAPGTRRQGRGSCRRVRSSLRVFGDSELEGDPQGDLPRREIRRGAVCLHRQFDCGPSGLGESVKGHHGQCVAAPESAGESRHARRGAPARPSRARHHVSLAAPTTPVAEEPAGLRADAGGVSVQCRDAHPIPVGLRLVLPDRIERLRIQRPAGPVRRSRPPAQAAPPIGGGRASHRSWDIPGAANPCRGPRNRPRRGKANLPP